MRGDKAILYRVIRFALTLQPGLFLLGLGLKDDFLKLFLVSSALLFIVQLLFDSSWKAILWDRAFHLVLGFFGVLFLFGVVLSEDFYQNQKYFFYFYPAYLFAFVNGLYWGKKREGRRIVEKSVFLLGWLVSLTTLAIALRQGRFEFWSGRFGHYNQLGMFVGAVSSFVFASLLAGMNWIGIFSLVFFLWILVGTYSRGAMISFLISSGISVFLSSNGVRFKRNHLMLLGGMFVLFILLVGSFYVRYDSMRKRIEQTVHLSLSGRGKIWRQTLKNISQHPFVGHGLRSIHEGKNPHNQVLALVLAGGIMVGIYFVGMNVWILFKGITGRGYLPGIAMLFFFLLHSLIESSLVGIWDNSLLYWFSLGLASAKLEEGR